MSTEPSDPNVSPTPPRNQWGHGYSGWMYGHRHRRGGLTGGLILIALGILFLLDNLGLISWEWAQLWPVILIVIGVALLAGRFSR